MRSAISPPSVAVVTASTNVFCNAGRVEDSSLKVKITLRKVKVSGVTNCEETGENAVLNSAAYGRKSGSDRISIASAAAGRRHKPRRILRGAPYLPPSTA